MVDEGPAGVDRAGPDAGRRIDRAVGDSRYVAGRPDSSNAPIRRCAAGWAASRRAIHARRPANTGGDLMSDLFSVEAVIRRRLLANFRVRPDILAQTLPPPFEPRL